MITLARRTEHPQASRCRSLGESSLIVSKPDDRRSDVPPPCEPRCCRSTSASRVSAAMACNADRLRACGSNGVHIASTTAPATSKTMGSATTAPTISTFTASMLTLRLTVPLHRARRPHYRGTS